MDNTFLNQFSKNIKFNYTCFDRVIVRGYIRKFFYLGCIVVFLKAMGFSKRTNGVMRIFTDQLNSHILKEAAKYNIPIFWWPAVDGGNNGAKLHYVEKQYGSNCKEKGNSVLKWTRCGVSKTGKKSFPILTFFLSYIFLLSLVQPDDKPLLSCYFIKLYDYPAILIVPVI